MRKELIKMRIIDGDALKNLPEFSIGVTKGTQIQALIDNAPELDLGKLGYEQVKSPLKKYMVAIRNEKLYVQDVRVKFQYAHHVGYATLYFAGSDPGLRVLSRIEDADISYFENCTGITIKSRINDDELFDITFSTMSKDCGLRLSRAALNNLIVGAEIVEVREIHLDKEKENKND